MQISGSEAIIKLALSFRATYFIGTAEHPDSY